MIKNLKLMNKNWRGFYSYMAKQMFKTYKELAKHEQRMIRRYVDGDKSPTDHQLKKVRDYTKRLSIVGRINFMMAFIKESLKENTFFLESYFNKYEDSLKSMYEEKKNEKS